MVLTVYYRQIEYSLVFFAMLNTVYASTRPNWPAEALCSGVVRYIHQMNRVNSRNGSAMMTAP